MSLLTQFYNCDGGGGGSSGGLGTGSPGLYGFGPLSPGAIDGALIRDISSPSTILGLAIGAAGYTDYYYSPPYYPGITILGNGGTISIPQAGSTIHNLALAATGAGGGTFVYLNNTLGVFPGRLNTTFKNLALNIPSLSGNIEFFVCAKSIENFTVLFPPPNISQNIVYDFNLSALSSTEVDNILIALAAVCVPSSGPNCRVNIAGANAAPGPAGVAAKNTIAALANWAVTTN